MTAAESTAGFGSGGRRVVDAVLMTPLACYQMGCCCLHSSDPL